MQRVPHRLAPFLFSLVLLASACGGEPADRSAAPQASPSKESEAPERERKADPEDSPTGTTFNVTTFEGEEFAFEEQRGTPVVLNFWESW